MERRLVLILVTDPGRFGSFGDNPTAWLEAFYSPDYAPTPVNALLTAVDDPAAALGALIVSDAK